MSLLLKLGLALVALYVVIALAVMFGQRKLIYVPARERVPPSATGLHNVEELEIATPDGNRIVAWAGAAMPGQPTLLYLHGNAGSLVDRAERMRKYLDRGRGMLIMTYRGYGGSTGSPSEAANVADAILAYDTLVARGVKPDDIILYGESLGSGVAVQVAAKRKVSGIILDAPYTSIVDVAALVYPWLPVRPFVWDRYETLAHVKHVTAPLLVVHGARDALIPVEMGRAVFAAANEPKALAIIPGGGHSDHHLFGSYDVINRWIDELRARAR